MAKAAKDTNGPRVVADDPSAADHSVGKRPARLRRPADGRTRSGSRSAGAPDRDRVIEGALPSRRPATRRMYQRRRRTVLLLFLTLSVVVLVVGHVVQDDDRRAPVTAAAPVASAAPESQPPKSGVGPAAAAPAKPAPAVRPLNRPRSPAGFTFARGLGPVLGTAGPLRRFQVAVEGPRGPRLDSFADQVDRILGDPRSWIAARQFRLQRVPRAAAAEFTIYLSSRGTTDEMCGTGGLETDGYTSCRLPGQVIINIARWADAVPGYPASLRNYRAYAINHEVGHQLGHRHEGCPGRGRPAPVMMQQTYGLGGCVANSWPYVGGRRYLGPPTA